MPNEYIPLLCPLCKGANIVKNGRRKLLQRYRCGSCGSQFTSSGAMHGYRFSPEVMGSALRIYFTGQSCQEVVWSLMAVEPDDAPVSRQTVYRWVQTYSEAAHLEVARHKADAGAVWDAVAFAGGGARSRCVWFVVDRDSDYILAFHLSASENANDARTVLARARDHAERPPTAVEAVGSAYGEAVSQVFPGAAVLSPPNNVLQAPIHRRDACGGGLKG